MISQTLCYSPDSTRSCGRDGQSTEGPPPSPGPLFLGAYKPGLLEMAFGVPAPRRGGTHGAGPTQISALGCAMPSRPVPRGHQLILGRPRVSRSLRVPRKGGAGKTGKG